MDRHCFDFTLSALFLRRRLKCHVNVAKERLFHFVQTVNDPTTITVVHLISGKDKEGARSVSLVRGDDNDAESGLASVTSRHIYAVARAGAIKKGKCAGATLCAAVLEASREDPNAAGHSAVVNKGARPNREAKVRIIGFVFDGLGSISFVLG